MNNIIMQRPNESPMVTYVKKRIDNNLNFICLFSGSTGIGKTWNGISFAEQLNPQFDAEKHIAFSFKQTMQIIDNEDFLKMKYKSLVWDEPQIEISNRQWQSQINKLVNYLLSTFRKQNIILIWCSPYRDFLDCQSMKLLHADFRCTGVNKKTGLSRVMPVFLQYNDGDKQFYPHKLYVCQKGIPDSASKLDYWLLPKPSAKNIEIYERRKDEFNRALNKDINNSLEDFKKVEVVETKVEEKAEEIPFIYRGLPPIHVEMLLDYAKHGIIVQTARKYGVAPSSMGFLVRKFMLNKGDFAVLQKLFPKNNENKQEIANPPIPLVNA